MYGADFAKNQIEEKLLEKICFGGSRRPASLAAPASSMLWSLEKSWYRRVTRLMRPP